MSFSLPSWGSGESNTRWVGSLPNASPVTMPPGTCPSAVYLPCHLTPACPPPMPPAPFLVSAPLPLAPPPSLPLPSPSLLLLCFSPGHGAVCSGPNQAAEAAAAPALARDSQSSSAPLTALHELPVLSTPCTSLSPHTYHLSLKRGEIIKRNRIHIRSISMAGSLGSHIKENP